MVLQVPSTDSIGAGPRIDLSTTDNAYIGMGVTIRATSGNAIDGQGSNHSVWVNGRVDGATYGIKLGTSSLTSNEFVWIGATGSVSGSAGILMYGFDSRIVNYGDVFGRSYGIIADVEAGAPSTIANFGTIAGSYAGIIRNSTTDTGELRFTNHGMIIGDRSYRGSDFVDKIYNHGEMIGDVELRDGNDRYQGFDGTILGTVYGGNGNDVFMAGSGHDVFDGGDGIDVLDFRNSGKVQVSLDGVLANKGVAQGDIYTAFETIIGSGWGNDRLRGDSGDNFLRGLGGQDSLLGASGNDTLNGGYQKDRLTGGDGNDTFVFEKRSHAGDVIVDFGNTAGDNDVIHIKASGFGGGLSAGVLASSQFRALSDNVARDADDRFILRTGDKTLWFDADGTGSKAAYMVADLSSDAVLRANDIVII